MSRSVLCYNGAVFDYSGGTVSSFPGAVASVFGRTGSVTAQTGDYTAAQVGALSSAASFSGDGTGTVPALTLATTGVSAATYGDSTHVAQIAVDAKGRITSASNVAISGGGGSTELDYVERTTNLTVTATSDATAQAFITGNAVSYNGTTRIKIEIFATLMDITASQALTINIYDGSTDLGRLLGIQANAGTGSSNFSAYGARFLTPSNASHTYSLRAWKTGGTGQIFCGAGGTATLLPAWYRITTA